MLVMFDVRSLAVVKLEKCRYTAQSTKQYSAWCERFPLWPLKVLPGRCHCIISHTSAVDIKLRLRLGFPTSKYSGADCKSSDREGWRRSGFTRTAACLDTHDNSAHKWSTLQERAICESHPLKVLSVAICTGLGPCPQVTEGGGSHKTAAANIPSLTCSSASLR